MTLRIKGDFKQLRVLEQQLIHTDKMMRKVSKNMAEETIDLVKEGFRTETDPYGNKWAPKQRDDGRKVLSGETSNLKNGWHVTESSSGGYDVEASVDYAEPHQNPKRRSVRGTGGRFGKGHGRLKRPRRMMVPAAAKGMPREWDEALTEVAADTVKAHYRKR